MHTQPKVKHVAQIRGQLHATRREVLWLTKMSEARLFQLVLETGIAWISEYAREDRQWAMALMAEPMIWAWWRNEWNLRDEHIVKALYEAPEGERCTRYMQLHRMAILPWRPSFELLKRSYRVAVGMMADNPSRPPLKTGEVTETEGGVG